MSAAALRACARITLFVFPLAALGCGACGPIATDDAGAPLGDGFSSVTAIGATTVEVRFTRAIDALSVAPDAFTIERFTVVPKETVSVVSVTQPVPATVVLDTGALAAGETYTLSVDLIDVDGFAVTGTLNFVAEGALSATDVTFVVDDLSAAETWMSDLTLLVTVDDETGLFSETMSAFPLVDEGARLAATVSIAVDTARTLSVSDDGDPRVDRRAYAARVVDDLGRMVGPLVRFEVKTPSPDEIALPIARAPEIVTEPEPDLFPEPPVDPTPDDGVKIVRLVVDDRAAGEIAGASVKTSFNSTGAFDPAFPQTIPLTPMTGDFAGFYEATVSIAVDPARVLDGDAFETFPYIAYLVVDGVEYENLSRSFVAPDETPESVAIFLGRAGDTPVTFRVDVGGAFVTPSGSVRGHYPDEAIFLTGEWQDAVDALGNPCGDVFSGGEQPNLKMRPLDGHDGVWTRTIWLPPGRPYGWKVVRCHADDGCGPLNQLASGGSGRAFATVMKNLATDNVDAFADPNVGIIDPTNLDEVTAGGQSYDYTGGSVYEGDGVGTEPDPNGTPDGDRMFKQEAPDLVVVVGDAALVTRVFVVGTWRDVNLGMSPAEVIDASAPLDLNPFDYDDGFIGRYPPSREEP